jgi:hypothetical protein
MKRIHLYTLIGIAVAIVSLITFGFSSSDFSTYDSISSAKNKQGKYVHLIAKLDKSVPIEYNPAKNPNYLSFYITDSLGSRIKVIYLIANQQNWNKVKGLCCRVKCRVKFLNAKALL